MFLYLCIECNQFDLERSSVGLLHLKCGGNRQALFNAEVKKFFQCWVVVFHYKIWAREDQAGETLSQWLILFADRPARGVSVSLKTRERVDSFSRGFPQALFHIQYVWRQVFVITLRDLMMEKEYYLQIVVITKNKLEAVAKTVVLHSRCSVRNIKTKHFMFC